MPSCAHCGRRDLMQARMNDYQCLACGNRTSHDGKPLPIEPVFSGDNPHERRPM